MRIQEEICRKLWKSSPPKSTDEAQTCFSLEILCTEWMNGRRNAHSSLTGAKSPKILSLFWLLGHQTNVKIRKRTIISLRICSVFATLFTVKWWFSICWTIIILSLSLLCFLFSQWRLQFSLKRLSVFRGQLSLWSALSYGGHTWFCSLRSRSNL